LGQAIAALADMPERCPVADESEQLGITLRQLLYGRRRGVYRLLFSIEGETVSAMEPNAAQSQPPEGEPFQGPWNEGTGQPEVQPDGTHVFPVEEVSIPAHGVLGTGRGTVRWHPKEGVTFEVEGQSDPGVGVGAAARPGAGAMREMSRIPHLTARVAGMGSAIRLFELQPKVTNTIRFGTGGHPRKQTVSGRAAYATVELPPDHPLAFGHETTGACRLLVVDFLLYHWPNEERVEWTVGDEERAGDRKSLPLSTEPLLTLFRSSFFGGLRDAAWLVFEEEHGDKPEWYRPEVCLRAASLLSLLAGKRLPFLLKDRFHGDLLLRTYFGYHLLDDFQSESFSSQPVPLQKTTSAMRYGGEVVKALPGMYASYHRLSEWYDLDWIVGPLWYAARAYLDDTLALASVSLERLATAHEGYLKANKAEQKKPKFWLPAQGKKIRKALKEAVAKFAAERSLDLGSTPMAIFAEALDRAVEALGEEGGELLSEAELADLSARLKDVLVQAARDADLKLEDTRQKILEDRIDKLAQQTNRDKLTLVFEWLGIELSAEEVETIDRRNDSLHGRRTLEDVEDLEANALEARRFDVLRTAIHKACLALLGYKGRYINYAARPKEGGFPAENLVASGGE